MVNVRFFGMIRIALKIKSTDIEANSIEELMKIIAEQNSSVKYNELINSLILVNGKNITEFKALETPLKDGDQVEIFSPAIGG